MRRFIVFCVFTFFVIKLTSQDTIFFERIYIWEYNSNELTNIGKKITNDLCDTINFYKKVSKEVKVVIVEERKKEISYTIFESRTETLKEYFLKKDSTLNDVKFTTLTKYVKDYKHIEPHFINYYIMIIINLDGAPPLPPKE